MKLSKLKSKLNEGLEKSLVRKAIELMMDIRHEARSNPNVPKTLERNTFKLEQILLQLQSKEIENKNPMVDDTPSGTNKANDISASSSGL